jgi:hypothetical protein
VSLKPSPVPDVPELTARVEETRLPKGQEARYAPAELIGTDGYRLLEALRQDATADWLWQVPAVLAGGPRVRPAAVPVYRSGQGPVAARGDGGGDQRLPEIGGPYTSSRPGRQRKMSVLRRKNDPLGERATSGPDFLSYRLSNLSDDLRKVGRSAIPQP